LPINNIISNRANDCLTAFNQTIRQYFTGLWRNQADWFWGFPRSMMYSTRLHVPLLHCPFFIDERAGQQCWRDGRDYAEGVRAFTSMISNRFGVRRLFADRDRAPKTCRAIREWKVVNGKPSRSQDVAHLGDGISYPLIRLFPRILRSDNPGPMEDVKQRVDRPDPETASAARDVRRPRAARRNRGL